MSQGAGHSVGGGVPLEMECCSVHAVGPGGVNVSYSQGGFGSKGHGAGEKGAEHCSLRGLVGHRDGPAFLSTAFLVPRGRHHLLPDSSIPLTFY